MSESNRKPVEVAVNLAKQFLGHAEAYLASTEAGDLEVNGRLAQTFSQLLGATLAPARNAIVKERVGLNKKRDVQPAEVEAV